MVAKLAHLRRSISTTAAAVVVVFVMTAAAAAAAAAASSSALCKIIVDGNEDRATNAANETLLMHLGQEKGVRQ